MITPKKASFHSVLSFISIGILPTRDRYRTLKRLPHHSLIRCDVMAAKSDDVSLLPSLAGSLVLRTEIGLLRLRHDWMIVSVMYSSLFLVRHRIAHAPSEHWPPSSNCIIWDRLGNETYLERDMNSYPIYLEENLCKRERERRRG